MMETALQSSFYMTNCDISENDVDTFVDKLRAKSNEVPTLANPSSFNVSVGIKQKGYRLKNIVLPGIVFPTDSSELESMYFPSNAV